MRTSTLGISLLLASSTYAQWSTDPANPLVLCDALNTQQKLRVISDGAGGWFAFWSDQRADGVHGELYGQHLDAAGFSLWTANGKLVHTEPGSSIDDLAVARLDNGNVILAYLYRPGVYQDTLKAMAIDTNGDPVWSAPVHITQCGSPVLGLGDLTALATPGGAYIGWYDTYFGGSNGVNLTRITNDGALSWGIDGYAVPNAGSGPFELHGDHADGVIVQWRTSNGAGAPLMAMRVDATGTNVWPANVQTSLGSGGLAYAFHTTLDSAGAQLTAWVDIAHRIVMARLDTTGALTFSPSPAPVCTFSSDQDSPKLVVNDGFTFATWTDNRPPANYRDLYLQKFDADGTPQWTADGVPAIQLNTYIPNSGLVVSDSGGVIATIDGNVDGLSAMRVRANGTLAWPAPVQFCTPAFNPFYALQTELPDGEGGVAAFWEVFGGGDLYAAHIDRDGQLGDHTNVAEIPGPGAELDLRPSPTVGPFSVALSDRSQLRSVRAIDAQGRAALLPSTRNNNRLELDASSLANGIYTLEIVTDAGASTGRFIIAR